MLMKPYLLDDSDFIVVAVVRYTPYSLLGLEIQM